MARLPFFGLWVLAVISQSSAFQSSAPTSSCSTMMPRHMARAQDHSRNPPPYQITINDRIDTYTPNQRIDLELFTTDPSVLAKGFMLQAKTVSGDKAVGTFVDAQKGTKIMCDDKAVSHYRTYQVSKTRYHMTWVAPDTDMGDIVFVATVVESYNVFWTGVRSITLQHHVPTTTNPQLDRMLQDDSNVTLVCNEESLTALAVERPHVAILCDAHYQCPCGWFCCPTCLDGHCFGHAICRQPISKGQTTNPEEESEESEEESRQPPRRDRYAYRSRTW